MCLQKVGLVASVVAVGLALCLLALAPLGWRLGWWPFGVGLFLLLPASGAVAAGGAALALATLLSTRPMLAPRTLLMLLVVLAVGVSLAYVPLRYAYIRRTLPPINDVTTDTRNRPPFNAVLAARAAERNDRVHTPEPRLSQLQRAGYPDLAPVRTTLPVDKAYSDALAVARAMPGWTVVAADRDSGRIEASERSRWFGFTDDIVIRVAADPGGSRIDMRSASRKGVLDYGVNAARIRAYVAALRRRID